MYQVNDNKGLLIESTEEIESRVIRYRNEFATIMYRRYLELLPSLITYKYPDDSRSKIAVDFVKLELGLRAGREMVIGRCTDNKLRLWGYHNNNASQDEVFNLDNYFKPLTAQNINLIIDKKLIPNNASEITFENNNKGDFVVLRNKTVNLNSDFAIIKHYVEALTEIVVSRYSLAMQMKIMTFFIGQPNDETTNQVANKLYNGTPFVKVSQYFDPEESMTTFDNSNASSNLTELKREYQNYLSELNNMLGINSLAVDKESGVSNAESNGNTSYVTANANIYMEARRRAFHKLNDRFGYKIKTYYNDRIASEISQMTDLNISNESRTEGEHHENN